MLAMNNVTNIDQVTIASYMYIGGRNIGEQSVLAMLLVSIEMEIFDRMLTS